MSDNKFAMQIQSVMMATAMVVSIALASIAVPQRAEAGLLGGAIGGAIIGGLIGGKKGAQTGAVVGGIAGALK